MTFSEAVWTSIDPRPPTDWERAVLERLVEGDSAASELRRQIDSAQVVEECRCGCASVTLAVEQRAVDRVEDFLVVEAWGRDEDGEQIWVLLHTSAGFAYELEIQRSDGRPIHRRPEPAELATS